MGNYAKMQFFLDFLMIPEKKADVMCQKYVTRQVLIFYREDGNIVPKHSGIWGIFPFLALIFHLSPQN